MVQMANKARQAAMSIRSITRARLARLVRRVRFKSIQARLLVALMFVAVLTAMGIGIVSASVAYFHGRQQADDRLSSVAALKAVSIRSWADGLQTGLLTMTSDQFASQRISVVLGLARFGREYVWYDDGLLSRMQRYLEETGQFEEVCLVGLRGTAVLCTESRETTDDCHAEPFYQTGLSSPYTEIVFAPLAYEPQNREDPAGELEQDAQASLCGFMSRAAAPPFAILARPVISSEGEGLGMIVGRASARALIEILADRTGMGRTGRAYLVDPTLALLSADPDESVTERSVAGLRHSLGIGTALRDRSQISGMQENYRGDLVLGTYRWLPDFDMVLAVEQDLAEAFTPILHYLLVSLGMALIAMFAALAISFVVTRSISDALVELAKAATQIADGNLDRTAPVKRDDEIGVLATAFNRMTAKLRDLVGHLERRVQDRTVALDKANEALRRLALKMETGAEVSRQITSMLEVDGLLANAVRSIGDSFGYPSVSILLLDGTEFVERASTAGVSGRSARADNGSAGPNTEVARIAQDAVADTGRQAPGNVAGGLQSATQSELSIPLQVGNRTIGKLEVASDRPNAFTRVDILVMRSLAAQIATEIANARLHARNRELAVIEERSRIARDLHDSVVQSLYSLCLLSEGTRRLVRSGEVTNLEDYFERAAVTSRQALREMRLVVYNLGPAMIQQDGLLGAFEIRLEAVEHQAGVKWRISADGVSDLPLYVQECLLLVPESRALERRCPHRTALSCHSWPLGGALYNIGMEALSNVLRHSGASEVLVGVYTHGDVVVLQVSDDGIGFDQASPGAQGGMGLKSMQLRARDLKGAVTIKSSPGKGTTMTARFPCPAIAPLEGRFP